MNAKSDTSPLKSCALTQDEIRNYAYHLYLQGGCVPGRDLDNWLEAEACLNACIPKSESHSQRHQRPHHNRRTHAYAEDEMAVRLS